MDAVELLASELLLGAVLRRLAALGAAPEHVAHWQQGEFHHDHVLRLVRRPAGLEGDVVVVSTNCNAGVKEILVMSEVPDRWALWHARCPQNEAFGGSCPPVVQRARTTHWFDPCALLADDARSELRPEARRRQRGGGWEPVGS